MSTTPDELVGLRYAFLAYCFLPLKLLHFLQQLPRRRFSGDLPGKRFVDHLQDRLCHIQLAPFPATARSDAMTRTFKLCLR